jgi:hypothetical protein
MLKEKFLQHWKLLKPDQPLKPKPIPYKTEGSKYEFDTIRITGSREFVDAVLSHLKELLEYEGPLTRLGTSYAEAKTKEGYPTDSVAVYVTVHERGPEAKRLNLFVEACLEKGNEG